MLRHLAKRLLFAIPLVLLISVVAFVLLHIAPGGPFDKDRSFSEAVERNLRAKYHLDEPVWKQYLRYLGGLVQGDLGPSMHYRSHSVSDVIRAALPVSATLGLLAFGFAISVGVLLGFIAGARRAGWADYAGSLVALTAICIPAFVLGPLLVTAFAISWQLLPVGLWESPLHVVLPTLTLGIYFAGRIARLMREGVITVLQSPFMVTARAKGLGETAAFLRHGLRLAVLPVVSYSGPLLADLMTGSFVVESLFQLPGLGIFFVNSSLNRDYTMVVSLVVLYAVLIVALNVVVDLLYTMLDPRVRLS